MTPAPQDRVIIERRGIDLLIGFLRESGFTVLGPTVRDGAILHGAIDSTDDLPVGLRDEHGPGTYRLYERDDDALFGYVVGPTSPKATFHPAEATLWSGTADFTATAAAAGNGRFAFIGVRACELAAVAIQDRVFLGSGSADRTYAENRAGAFMVAVNCIEPGGTCFCTSMGTGPRATSGYDIALTEVIADGGHHFVAKAGTPEGATVLAQLESRIATEDEAAAADRLVEEASGAMGRSLDTAGIKEMLYRAVESPHWDAIAERCLTCANCTMVCPTCFCSTVTDSVKSIDRRLARVSSGEAPDEIRSRGESIDVTDRSDLATQAERVRRWDSCFNFEFSLVHGGPHRVSPSSRFRQWMTHKLASWYDQFGTSGCVGCGRCITWCPVGIDITAEAAVFWERDHANA
jgi:Fe-S-cluster-containing hydrogenase component 2